MTEQELDYSRGYDFGRQFAEFHLLQRMRDRITESRRDGNTQDFIDGFVDGVNDLTGGITTYDFKE